MTDAPPLLAAFVEGVAQLCKAAPDEATILAGARPALARLVARDDWLPPAYAAPGPTLYRQYLLYREPEGRFSVVSFVWGPGQSTPVHDHTVWGLIGVLRGVELSQRYVIPDAGPPVPVGGPKRLEAGAVDAVSPALGDIHKVTNALDDQVSVSIHLYGADIGAVQRWTYPPEGGRKPFVSGYSNDDASPAFTVAPRERAA